MTMRGYFGIGICGGTKPRNAGALFRTAHAFGAGFVFTVQAAYDTRQEAKTDTSRADSQLPFYEFPKIDDLILPRGCQLVGIELLDDAVDLPSFRHPIRAAYVLGPERGWLPPALVERCAHVIKIPTRFSLNVGLAGALVMYDRLVSLGRFPGRPVHAGGAPIPLEEHVHGGPVLRRQLAALRALPPRVNDQDDGEDSSGR